MQIKDGIDVDFYRRLEVTLSRQGIEKEPRQTQREFANAARESLLKRQLTERIAEIPAQIVAQFYRVRFGGATLDSQEVETIELALHSLESQLHAPTTTQS